MPGGEEEGGPDPGLALEPDAAAHQLHQAAGDGEPEPGAAVLARGRHVGLGERLEELRGLLRRHAHPGVAHGELQLDLVAGPLQQLDGEPDLAALGELDRVVDEVGEDLSETQRVAAQVLGDRARDVDEELEPLVVGLLGRQRDDGGDDVVDLEVRGLEVELAGLDLREVEDVVDDPEQGRAGIVDLADVVALLGGERRLEGEVRQADDGVHRRPDLVAHVGQEHRLHLRRLLGLALGDVQLLLLRDQLLFLREQLLLGLRQLFRLLLEPARLLLRLLEQLAGPHVAGQDLHAQGDDGQELLDQRRLLRGQGAERGELDHPEELGLRHEGPGQYRRRRGRAEPRRDAQILRRQTGQDDRPAIPRALSHQAVPQREGVAGLLALTEAVAGDERHALRGGIERIQPGHAASERRHEPGHHALSQLGERRGALQLGRDPGRVGLDPALLLHGGGAALEDLHGAREGARLVGLPRERHLLVELALRDRLDRPLQPLHRPDDAPIGHESHRRRQRDREDDSPQQGAPRLLDGQDGRLTRGLGDLFVVAHPVGHSRAGLLAERREAVIHERRRRVMVAGRCEPHGLLGDRDPLACPLTHLHGQRTVAIVGDERVLVPAHEPDQLGLLPIEDRLELTATARLVRQHVAPGVGPHLSEELHDGRREGQAADLRLRHEPAALVDLVQPRVHEDAEGDQGDQGNAQENEQALGDRHRPALRWERGAPAAARRAYAPLPRLTNSGAAPPRCSLGSSSSRPPGASSEAIRSSTA